MDQILLNSIPLSVRLGVPDAERAHPQTVHADLACRADLLPACATDDFARAIDYAALHATVLRTAAARPYALVESLAESIAQAILAEFPIESLRLRIRKPAALADHGVEWAGVEIERSRHA